MTEDDDLPTDGARAPFRRSAGVLIVVTLVLVELAFAAAWLQLRSAGDAVARADSLSAAFTDSQRLFQELELLASTEPSFSGEQVDTTLQLLDRQLSVATGRLDDPETSRQLADDIVELTTHFEALRELSDAAPGDTERAFVLADAAQRATQAAVDRTATMTRDQILADAEASTHTATLLGVGAAVALLTGVGLLWIVLLRYQRSFDEAWAVALDRQGELAESNVQLAALARTRERFVSVLSHELRTPLAVIGAVGETLELHGDRVDDETRADMFASLRRQVGRQRRMIDDLLLVALHANSEPEPEPTDVDLASVLRTVAEDSGLHGHKATYSCEPSTVARVDPHHLEQVVLNLVRNAEKYGGEAITVRAGIDGDDVVVTVADDGDGVPEELRPVLFEAYTQDADTASDGVGLGLSITRQLVEANGGTVGYRDGEDGGAVFELRLPRGTTVAEPAASTP